jgi:hypothetical protein
MIGDRFECQHYGKARLGHRVMLPRLSPGWRFLFSTFVGDLHAVHASQMLVFVTPFDGF